LFPFGHKKPWQNWNPSRRRRTRRATAVSATAEAFGNRPLQKISELFLEYFGKTFNPFGQQLFQRPAPAPIQRFLDPAGF
jgi:hypothetical protein